MDPIWEDGYGKTPADTICGRAKAKKQSLSFLLKSKSSLLTGALEAD
jgi:hypothetical protein